MRRAGRGWAAGAAEAQCHIDGRAFLLLPSLALFPSILHTFPSHHIHTYQSASWCLFSDPGPLLFPVFSSFFRAFSSSTPLWYPVRVIPRYICFWVIAGRCAMFQRCDVLFFVFCVFFPSHPLLLLPRFLLSRCVRFSVFSLFPFHHLHFPFLPPQCLLLITTI